MLFGSLFGFFGSKNVSETKQKKGAILATLPSSYVAMFLTPTFVHTHVCIKKTDWSKRSPLAHSLSYRDSLTVNAPLPLPPPTSRRRSVSRPKTRLVSPHSFRTASAPARAHSFCHISWRDISWRRCSFASRIRTSRPRTIAEGSLGLWVRVCACVRVVCACVC